MIVELFGPFLLAWFRPLRHYPLRISFLCWRVGLQAREREREHKEGLRVFRADVGLCVYLEVRPSAGAPLINTPGEEGVLFRAWVQMVGGFVCFYFWRKAGRHMETLRDGLSLRYPRKYSSLFFVS